MFGLDGAGTEPAVLIDAPDIRDLVGDLADSAIRTLLEQLAGFISDLKDQFLSLDFLDMTIPGTDYSINGILDEMTILDNGLGGVPTADTALEAILDIDTYFFAYLDTVDWSGFAGGTVSISQIWNGLVTFLQDHWMITLPDIAGTGLPSFFTVDDTGPELTVEVDITWSMSESILSNLATDLAGSGLVISGDLNFDFEIEAGLSFDFTIDLAGENSSFNFEEFYLSAAVLVDDINLTITYQDLVGLTTHVGSDYGDLELNLGGSFYMQDGSFTFDHEHNLADDVDFENSVSLYLPLDLLIGAEGVELGNITFADSDFYDGELSPGFNVNLQNVGELFDTAVYLVLDWLGTEIEDLRGDLVPVYAADGSVISEGYEALTKTIPGTDISVNNVLGLEQLLNIGTYIRHYLRPQLGDTGFTRDPSIPLGNPGAAGETGDSYYGSSGPSLGGFFEYMEAYWIPTLGGQAGGFTWEMITDGPDIVGVDLLFEQDFTFDRQFSLNFGEEVEAIGLEVDGQVELNLEVAIDLAMSLSFNWGTDGGTGDDTIDFDIDRLNFSGHASADDVVIGASIGPLSVSLGSEDCEKGRLALDLGAEASYIDGVVSFTPTANTATDHNNYIDAYLPVYASIGDVNFGSCSDPPQISLSGTIFPSAGGPELSFSHENMEQLLDFSDFNIGSLISSKVPSIGCRISPITIS